MATLDELVIRIKADASKLESEMRKAENITRRSTDSMKSGVNGLVGSFRGLVPAIGIAGIFSFGKSAIEAAGRLTDLANSIDFSTGKLAKIEPILAGNGASLESFAMSIGILNDQIGSAIKGDQGAIKAFEQLGIAAQDLFPLSGEERFQAVVRALASIEDQAIRTEAGRNLLGRGFLKMNSSLQELSETTNEVDKELESAIARVDEFEDSMTQAAINAKKAFIELFAEILNVNDALTDTIGKASQGAFANAKIGTTPRALDLQQREQEYAQKAKAAGFATQATFMVSDQDAMVTAWKDRNKPKNIGGSSEKAASAEKRLNDLRQEGTRITEQNLTAYEKYSAGVEKAQSLLKAGYIDEITFQREIIRLQGEFADEGEKSMQRVSDATQELTVSIRSSLANAFEDAIFNAKSFSGSMTSILDGIARQIARTAFIDPLANSTSSFLTDSIKGSGLFTGLFGAGGGGATTLPWLQGFAEGGNPPVGVPSIVGENGPEIIVPKSASTVIPNHALGGSSISVNNIWNISPGVQGTVRKELMQAAPAIVNQSVNAVMAAVQQGGKASQILGKRS